MRFLRDRSYSGKLAETLKRTFLEGKWYIGCYDSENAPAYYLQHRHGNSTFNAFYKSTNRGWKVNCNKCGEEPPDTALGILKLAEWNK